MNASIFRVKFNWSRSLSEAGGRRGRMPLSDHFHRFHISTFCPFLTRTLGNEHFDTLQCELLFSDLLIKQGKKDEGFAMKGAFRGS